MPLLAPIFVPLAGASIDWDAAATPASIVLTVVLIQLARQYLSKKPAKVWRGTPRIPFAVDVTLLLSATHGLLYATKPWRPEFEVEHVLAVNGGFALCGSEEIVAGGPASLSREAWVVLLTMIGAVPAAVGWCYADLRRRLRKGS